MKMNKVQNSFVLVVFMVSITLTLMITVGNNAFAIEYTNYTSEKYGIQFEYPSTWMVTEKISRFDEGPLIKMTDPATFSVISINYNDALLELIPSMSLKESLELMLQMGKDDYTIETDVIESPSILTISNQTAGTFVLATKQKFDVDAERLASQTWLVPTSNHVYMLVHMSAPEDFDSATNSEIRNHFINSIKFLGDTEPQQKSRFD